MKDKLDVLMRHNIALLTIIADIGMEFSQKLPGYALDLATNTDIILNDITRLFLLIKNPHLEMLEKQILMTMGIPGSLPNRYDKKDIKQYDLLNYVIDSQISYDEEIKIRCHKILDYLYSIVPNDKENATKYLQIQKMDLRTAQVVKVDDTTIALIPTATGEAEKITIENEKQRQPEKTIASLINDCNKKISKNEFKLKDCLEMIELLLETRKNCITPEVYDKVLINFLIMALNDKTLDDDTRAGLSQIWIDGIKRYFSMQSFIFEYSYSWVLFAQMETNVCGEIKKQIKQLILDLILYEEQNGIVEEIARYAKRYLTTKEQLARSVFNTIFKLAEDEMNHQKFNAEYIKKHRQKEKFKFFPNAQPKLLGADVYIEEDKRMNLQTNIWTKNCVWFRKV